MLKGVDVKHLVTFEDHQIMAVSLVIAEEQVLAMCRIYLLPVLQGQFNGRKRRMRVHLVSQTILLKKVQHLFYPAI
jgi:hypothetical protein